MPFYFSKKVQQLILQTILRVLNTFIILIIIIIIIIIIKGDTSNNRGDWDYFKVI